MIDIHSHVLYGMDDGAKTIEESVALCMDARKNGISILTCTPHFADYDYIYEFVNKRDSHLAKLKETLKEKNIDIKLATGAELFLSDQIFDAPNLDDLTLNYSRYMLCEFPMGEFDTTRGLMWIDELIDRGYYPIVAHPERYLEFHKNKAIIRELLKKRVLFQVNFNSLAGLNTDEVLNFAVSLIREHIALFIATDAHNLDNRHTRIKERIPAIPQSITAEHIRNCMLKYPKIILSDENIFDYVK